MKVIISQTVCIDGENFPSSWEKGYDSTVIPRVGDMIEDPIWKDPGEYEVRNVTINYYATSILMEHGCMAILVTRIISMIKALMVNS